MTMTDKSTFTEYWKGSRVPQVSSLLPEGVHMLLLLHKFVYKELLA